MRLGCMLYSLSRSLRDGTLTLPGAFGLIAECGGEGVDLGLGLHGGHTLSEVREMVADAGLAVSSHIGGVDLTQADSAQRRQATDAIRRLLDEAEELGTHVLLVTTGLCRPGQDAAKARRNIAEGLREVLPDVKSRGLTLTIEDFGAAASPYQTSAEVMECCELAGPDLMVTYDSGNMVMGDEDPVDFLRAVAPRVRHAHAKDWELLPGGTQGGLASRSGKRYRGTVVGQGVLDYPAIVAALREMDYQGFLSFEYEGSDNPVERTQEGMAYLRELLSA